MKSIHILLNTRHNQVYFLFLDDLINKFKPNEGIEEQTKAHDSIVVPNMGKAILMSEIISNIAGLILNFLIQTPIVYGAASLASKKKRLV